MNLSSAWQQLRLLMVMTLSLQRHRRKSQLKILRKLAAMIHAHVAVAKSTRIAAAEINKEM